MDKKKYLDNIEYLDAQSLAFAVLNKIVTFKELQATGDFEKSKQTEVKKIIEQKDDEEFNAADTIDKLNTYLEVFIEGKHREEVRLKIQQIQVEEAVEKEREDSRNAILQEIRNNPNSVTPDELFEVGITADDIRQMNIPGITDKIIDAVYSYRQPNLIHNKIPQSTGEIPSGYTDVFFWGIPSSGKTCALASIINTMKSQYSIADPDIDIKFGATYRHSLERIFDAHGIGNLPDRTVEDITQYMPFLFKAKHEKNYRQISFFELSGEVFKHFYDVVYNPAIANNQSELDKVKIGFDTLKLVLDSNNQKIHYFFIDYDYHVNTKQAGWSQAQYLEAATTYFKGNNDIFKKKTDAIYVVITKSDEIKEGYDDADKLVIAKKFLERNFGSFMDLIKTGCKKEGICFKVKIFSIGKVWFKRICKIERSYAHAIINDLLCIKPKKKCIFKDFFNS